MKKYWQLEEKPVIRRFYKKEEQWFCIAIRKRLVSWLSRRPRGVYGTGNSPAAAYKAWLKNL